jgi:hypothetical protein
MKYKIVEMDITYSHTMIRYFFHPSGFVFNISPRVIDIFYFSLQNLLYNYQIHRYL